MTINLSEIKAAAKAATRYAGYLVDRDGNVWSTWAWRGQSMRKLTPHPNSHGYPSVKVKVDGGMKKALVHILVCEAFRGPKTDPSHQARHMNGIRADCRADNLEWGTPRENALDRKRHGTERAAENGRASAHKLVGRKKTHCLRGHDKQGRLRCNECHRIQRREQSDADRP